ncbi:MAG TPA: enoyl-CoA hydratase/isomerase family protein [Thermoanaerobaculia bacterium]|nr:enoyl-CoA hydratase/isomerase family protein [Thermoanaerobaculia bacterium]
MPHRFTITRDARTTRIVFDDGGMNLLSSDALRELGRVVAELRGCEFVEFSSARPGLFAAGADMAEMAAFTAADADAFSKLGQDVMNAIEALPATTIARIDGDCFGGALDLALAFDHRHATPRSRFAHPGARIGIVTGFGGTTRWRKVMTPAAARQLFLANRVFSAAEALQMGLVDRLYNSDPQ